MRLSFFAVFIFLFGCASEPMALAPPAGVDFTGRWNLNIPDSDDPAHLLQAQFDRPGPGGYGRAGSGGDQGRPGGSRGGLPGGVLMGPAMPSLLSLSDALHWPGKQIEVKQVAGVIAFSSEGITRMCQPMDREKPRPGRLRGRSGRSPERDGGSARCGWEQKTLIVQGGEPDEDQPPYEERYSLSADGQRLIGVVGFTGGRSNGFTVSRVWDKVP